MSALEYCTYYPPSVLVYTIDKDYSIKDAEMSSITY